MQYSLSRVFVLVAWALTSACSVDSRSPSVVGDTQSTSQLPEMPFLGKPSGLDLGAACASAADCGSGFCTDGVCCESACNGVCVACSGEGRCDVVPDDDADCPEVSCPPSDQCVLYPPVQTGGRCSGLGQCRSLCSGAAVDKGPLCTLDGVAEARCDGKGQCADSHQPNGETCQVDAECLSEHCVDSVCCAEACNGVCEVCRAPDGACVADGADATCGENGRTCFGRGQCELPLGRECTTANECGSGQCVASVSSGASVCCEQACATGQRCSGDGHCVDPAADLGKACQAGADCTLGQCVDGVCCDSACAGTCERCNAPSQEGRCVADDASTACDALAPNRRCLFRGLCQLPLGQPCVTSDDCGSGHCEAAVSGGSVCCAAACQAGVEACTTGANGGACQVVPLANGGSCASNAQCVSDSCQQSRCCPNDCGGVCEVCSVRGACEVPPAGSDGGCAPVNCSSQSTACRTFGSIGNLCAALGRCKTLQDCPSTPTQAGTLCTLNGGASGACDGSGSCVSLPPAQLIVDNGQLDLGAAIIAAQPGNSGTVRVTNPGGVSTGNVQVSSSGEFTARGTCIGQRLAAASSCTLTVTFVPSAPGDRSATLTISGGSGVTASVTLHGVGQCGASQTALTIDGRLQCRLVNGTRCSINNSQQCQDGFCRAWFLDVDGDGYGSTELDVCGQADSNRPPPVMVTGNRGNVISENYVSLPGDCCDVLQENAAGAVLPPIDVNPAQTTPGGPTFCAAAGLGGLPGDVNCDGVETVGGIAIAQALFISCTAPSVVAAHPTCEDRGGYNHPISCGAINDFTRCQTQPDGSCLAIPPNNGGPVSCL